MYDVVSAARRAWVAGACLVALVGCSSTETTPAGPLGEVDLRAHLTEGAPEPPSELTEYEATVELCDVDDDPFEPIEVHIVWHAFNDGADAYITDYAVELTRPSDHAVVSLKTDKPSLGSLNLTPGDPYLGVTEVSIRCERSAVVFPKKYVQSLLGMVQLVADGRALE